MGMTGEKVIEYVRDLDRQNRRHVGDWYSNEAARVAAYWERDAEAKDALLRNWIHYSTEYKASWGALEAVAVDLLRRHLPIPDVLADWLALSMERTIKKPAKGAVATWMRDYGLARMVVHLSQLLVMTPTRNDGSPPCSACDFVAVALNFDYKTVVNAYLKHKDGVF